MTFPADMFLGTINSSFSALALIWLLPIAAMIYLDIRFVYYGIKKEGGMKLLALIISFIISLGAVTWGLWSAFTEFSLVSLFVAVGGGILLLFSLRSLTLDKDDLKDHV
jgi:hypothetical protein